ncbi:MAG: hypothetical protein AAB523_02130 [Patescibacteria group bacterium]
MIWQDIGIMIIQWAFFFALIPTVLSKDKPPFFTSLLNGILLLFLAIIFSTLHLWGSVTSTLLVGGTWFFIGFQKYRTESKTKLLTASAQKIKP